jgi:hypothetical protein
MISIGVNGIFVLLEILNYYFSKVQCIFKKVNNFTSQILTQSYVA